MMQPWFEDAKLGIFIHWGIYAVNGIPESWSIINGDISYDDYMKQSAGFTAERYDPNAWADLFVRAGARYAVLTTKHHDGVALFDTQLSDLNVVQKTPAARDLVALYCDALRTHGLRVGLYFSHLDWSHPDYSPIPVEERSSKNQDVATFDRLWPEGQARPEWRRFLEFHHGQLDELCTRYGDVDLLWFDGDWSPSGEWWEMKDLRDRLQCMQPNVILNSRMQGYGDYQTPEQAIPISPPDGPWEFCTTINDSWGYQPRDLHYKSSRQIIQMFAECIGMGGNLLLDVGPKPDGTIPEEQVERLEILGGWIRKHEEAVYGTAAGLPFGHFYGPTTLSKDKTTLYLYQFDRPDETVSLKGIRNTIRRISVVGRGSDLHADRFGGASWVRIPGVLQINVPHDALDKYVTVIKVELDGPLDLYHGSGGAIESN